MKSRRALVIGIDQYAIRPLRGCGNDAAAVASKLSESEFGFETTLLLNEKAKRSSIRQAIDAALNDSIFTIIYFAGHGVRTKTATYLATFDTEPGDEGIDLAYFPKAIQRLAGQQQTVLLILDCCHAGDAEVRTEDEQLVVGGEKFRPLDDSDLPMLAGNGRVLLAACLGATKAKEVSFEGKVHGLFTHNLLSAFAGKASDGNGVLTISAVHDYVSSEMEKAGAQLPRFSGDQNGRILIATNIKSTGDSKEKSVRLVSEIARDAGEHMRQYFEAATQMSQELYISAGHREACQRLTPIVDWFNRRLSDNPELMRDANFASAHANLYQQYQNLGSLIPGTMLDSEKFIDTFIGSGTFGTVWKISDNRSRIAQCFKAYHATELRDAEKAARFERGFRAMAQLDHPNIVKVHDFVRVPLGFYMDYIDGPNLRKYNPATSLEFEQIIELMLFVGETLRHAHGRNVLHRDVKPENILLEITASGRAIAHLTDFDLSWFSTATKLTKLAGDGFGSHFYASPEQMNSPASPVSHRSTVDVYSFGQVLYFALCGRDPGILDEEGNAKSLTTTLGRYAISEIVARQVLSLYQDCTRKIPEKRIGDFGAVCVSIAAILAAARAPSDLDSTRFLRELKYLIVGLEDNAPTEGHITSVNFRSPSGRTEVSVGFKKEAEKLIAIEAIFTANQIIIQGLSSVAARQKVNERIDAALQSTVSLHHSRRQAGKSGAFQSTINFEAISKDAKGLNKAREIIMNVVDCIERT